MTLEMLRQLTPNRLKVFATPEASMQQHQRVALPILPVVSLSPLTSALFPGMTFSLFAELTPPYDSRQSRAVCGALYPANPAPGAE